MPVIHTHTPRLRRHFRPCCGALVFLFTACAGSVWQSAGEGCAARGDMACQAAAHEIEAKLEKDWRALGDSFPPRGQIIIATDVDASGKLGPVQLVDESAGSEVARHVRELLEQKAPYPASARRRVYVRFSFSPLQVTSLMPPRGDDRKLHALVAQLQPSFRECFQTAIAENGDFFFKGALLFSITEAGAVKDARLEGDKQDAVFRSCVLEEANALKLPAWEYTGKAVRYPLQFEVRIKRS